MLQTSEGREEPRLHNGIAMVMNDWRGRSVTFDEKTAANTGGLLAAMKPGCSL